MDAFYKNLNAMIKKEWSLLYFFALIFVSPLVISGDEGTYFLLKFSAVGKEERIFVKKGVACSQVENVLNRCVPSGSTVYTLSILAEKGDDKHDKKLWVPITLSKGDDTAIEKKIKGRYLVKEYKKKGLSMPIFAAKNAPDHFGIIDENGENIPSPKNKIIDFYCLAMTLEKNVWGRKETETRHIFIAGNTTLEAISKFEDFKSASFVSFNKDLNTPSKTIKIDKSNKDLSLSEYLKKNRFYEYGERQSKISSEELKKRDYSHLASYEFWAPYFNPKDKKWELGLYASHPLRSEMDTKLVYIEVLAYNSRNGVTAPKGMAGKAYYFPEAATFDEIADYLKKEIKSNDFLGTIVLKATLGRESIEFILTIGQNDSTVSGGMDPRFQNIGKGSIKEEVVDKLGGSIFTSMGYTTVAGIFSSMRKGAFSIGGDILLFSTPIFMAIHTLVLPSLRWWFDAPSLLYMLAICVNTLFMIKNAFENERITEFYTSPILIISLFGAFFFFGGISFFIMTIPFRYFGIFKLGLCLHLLMLLPNLNRLLPSCNKAKKLMQGIYNDIKGNNWKKYVIFFVSLAVVLLDSIWVYRRFGILASSFSFLFTYLGVYYALSILYYIYLQLCCCFGVFSGMNKIYKLLSSYHNQNKNHYSFFIHLFKLVEVGIIFSLIKVGSGLSQFFRNMSPLPSYLNFILVSIEIFFVAAILMDSSIQNIWYLLKVVKSLLFLSGLPILYLRKNDIYSFYCRIFHEGTSFKDIKLVKRVHSSNGDYSLEELSLKEFIPSSNVGAKCLSFEKEYGIEDPLKKKQREIEEWCAFNKVMQGKSPITSQNLISDFFGYFEKSSTSSTDSEKEEGLNDLEDIDDDIEIAHDNLSNSQDLNDEKETNSHRNVFKGAVGVSFLLLAFALWNNQYNKDDNK